MIRMKFVAVAPGRIDQPLNRAEQIAIGRRVLGDYGCAMTAGVIHQHVNPIFDKAQAFVDARGASGGPSGRVSLATVAKTLQMAQHMFRRLVQVSEQGGGIAKGSLERLDSRRDQAGGKVALDFRGYRPPDRASAPAD